MRLRQTAALMEWMVENCPDPEAIAGALEAVNSARAMIQGLRLTDSQDSVAR